MTQTTSQTIDQIISFIQSVFSNTKKNNAVIAVSGGIDSAVSLTLLVKAIGKDYITPLLMPYGDQSMKDATSICERSGFTSESLVRINIKRSVDTIVDEILANNIDKKRLGNIMARVRMILLFDEAAKRDALVCGTENKSEHYLGYFTRFGDEASDFEPLSTLYKTEVRQVAQALHLSPTFLEKKPSAGLWANQTDEDELGFSYAVADQVLRYYIDDHQPTHKIALPHVSKETVEKVVNHIERMAFKREVPYSLHTGHS